MLPVTGQPMMSFAVTVRVTCPFCTGWNVMDGPDDGPIIMAPSALQLRNVKSDAFVTVTVDGQAPPSSARTTGVGTRVGIVTLLCEELEELS